MKTARHSVSTRLWGSTKLALTIIVIASTFGLSLAGCGPKQLRVGATSVPHAEILEFAKPLLKKEGVDMKIVEFNDYVQPNLQLADKQLDANFFQHIPYLEDFSTSRKLELTWIAKVHVEPMGIYPGKAKSLSDLAPGASVGVPNDVTNLGRALLLLENAGLLKLKAGVGFKATTLDITENPKNLRIVELQAEILPRSLKDLDVAVINGNFAIQAGLSPLKDALCLENADSPFANVLVVRKGDEQNPDLVKLAKVLNSEEVRRFILEKYKGSIVPAF